MKYEVGNKVRITSTLTEGMCSSMEEYCSTVMTIAEVRGYMETYLMEEDNGSWNWNDNNIVGLVKKHYQVGDKVLIRSDLQAGHDYGGVYFNYEMEERYVGKVVTVSATTRNNRFNIEGDENNWFFSSDMVYCLVKNADLYIHFSEYPEWEHSCTVPEIELSAEDRERLIQETIDCLEHYKWRPTYDGVSAIIDKWWGNKKHQIALFSKMPGWDAKNFMVVQKNVKFYRDLDKSTIFSILQHWKTYDSSNLLVVSEERKSFPFSEIEISNRYSQLMNMIETFKLWGHDVIVRGYSYENLPELYKEKEHVRKMYDKYQHLPKYTTESNVRYKVLTNLFDHMGSNMDEVSNVLNDKMAQYMNEAAVALGMKNRFQEGQKTMKALNKILTFVNFKDCDSEFSHRWARLGDAISPLSFERTVVISFNPVDYLRSSMGTSWTSCHTIDRADVDNRNGESYSGMHAKGTLSYMLDNCTAVMYTVHTDYDGDTYQWADKVTRQLYHLGTETNPFFIQGRLYPQSNDDGAKEQYKQYRNIMQEVLSQVWETNNLWGAPYSSYSDSTLYTSCGSHYKDYESFPNCMISKLKDVPDNVFKKITIGAQELCIECGRESNSEDNELSCCSSFSSACCADCGAAINLDDEDDYVEIDGEYYCMNCVTYCEYHEQYELNSENEFEYVSNYGRVCRNAIDESNMFVTCERCGEVILEDDGILTADGNYYCDETCAARDGYVYCKDTHNYISEEDAFYCTECGSYFENEDNIVEHEDGNLCEECYERLELEEEVAS